MTPTDEDIKRNIENAEKGKPLDMPLIVLDGEMKKKWFNDGEYIKAKKEERKTYNQRPEVKKKIKAYQKAYYQRPEVKKKTNAYQKAYNQRPEVKAYKKA